MKNEYTMPLLVVIGWFVAFYYVLIQYGLFSA